MASKETTLRDIANKENSEDNGGSDNNSTTAENTSPADSAEKKADSAEKKADSAAAEAADSAEKKADPAAAEAAAEADSAAENGKKKRFNMRIRNPQFVSKIADSVGEFKERRRKSAEAKKKAKKEKEESEKPSKKIAEEIVKNLETEAPEIKKKLKEIESRLTETEEQEKKRLEEDFSFDYLQTGGGPKKIADIESEIEQFKSLIAIKNEEIKKIRGGNGIISDPDGEGKDIRATLYNNKEMSEEGKNNLIKEKNDRIEEFQNQINSLKQELDRLKVAEKARLESKLQTVAAESKKDEEAKRLADEEAKAAKKNTDESDETDNSTDDESNQESVKFEWENKNEESIRVIIPGLPVTLIKKDDIMSYLSSDGTTKYINILGIRGSSLPTGILYEVYRFNEEKNEWQWIGKPYISVRRQMRVPGRMITTRDYNAFKNLKKEEKLSNKEDVEKLVASKEEAAAAEEKMKYLKK